jgi:hypothetical protein
LTNPNSFLPIPLILILLNILSVCNSSNPNWWSLGLRLVAYIYGCISCTLLSTR